MPSAGFTHDGVTYKLSVASDEAGRTRIEVTSSNPPLGLDKTLYIFDGKLPFIVSFVEKLRHADVCPCEPYQRPDKGCPVHGDKA